MKLGSMKKQKIGDDYNSIILEQWKTCVEMANSNTEKRANSNNIYITINSALLTIATFTLDYKSIMLSVVGVVVCILWMNSKDSPIHNAPYEWQLKEAIKNQMQYASCVLVLAGVYSTYSKWINIELDLTKNGFYSPKKIIAIEPWAAKKTSTVVKSKANYIVKWQTSSIVQAIKNC